jgi:hypothetical protein
VQKAVQFILEKLGLWESVLQHEKVMVATTVDGGDLA